MRNNEAPKLFGNPGKRYASGWRWKSGPWDVYYEPGEGRHYVEIQHFDCLIFDRWYRRRETALRALERTLTSRGTGLRALGVPGV